MEELVFCEKKLLDLGVEPGHGVHLPSLRKGGPDGGKVNVGKTGKMVAFAKVLRFIIIGR